MQENTVSAEGWTLTLNNGYTDIFLAEANGVLQIVIEKIQLSDHTSDGFSWAFSILTYKDNPDLSEIGEDANEQQSNGFY